MTHPRPMDDDDLAWMHALNQEHAVELSSMTLDDFTELAERAFYAGVVDPDAGFLLAFDKKPAPESPNFDWFQARYEDTVYIDRIAVAANERRKGHAAALYEDLFRAARAAGFAQIGCEVNIDPPNPASDAFHAALGFEPVGEARLDDRDKTVGYFLKAL